MNGPIKAKVTPRAEFDRSRPPSPLKRLPTSPSPTPAPRPRAKVNTSAQIGARKIVGSPPSQNLASTTRTNISAPRAPITRAPSPFKPTQAFTAQTSSSSLQIKAKVSSSARSNVSATSSAPSVPELRHRALTATEAASSAGPRARRGSLSSHVSSSSGIARGRASPPKLAPATSNEENEGSTVGTGIRVKSKVTRLAGHTSPPPQSLPPSPSFAARNRPARVPSVSNLSLSPPLVATPGPRSAPLSPPPGQINGHARYATTREGPKANQYQPFPSRDDSSIGYHNPTNARIDPARIPLPQQSPPASTVSFSSRSSARSSVSCETRNSDSSGSSAPTLQSRLNGNGLVARVAHSRTSSIDGLGIQGSPLSREPSRDNPSPAPASDDEHDTHDTVNDEARKMRNEAKSNRKIADLEITNKSLLAINSQLEASKHRQAKEIRDLRRKLRESILILPPPAYRAAKSSLSAEDMQDDEDDEEEEEEEADKEPVIEGKADEAYTRVKSLIEALLESGRRALESKPEDFTSAGTGVTKVLSEEEARTWRGEDSRSFVEPEDDDTSSYMATEDDPSRPLTPSRIAIPSDGPDSEDEVEESLIINERDIPPITVTPSPSP